MIAVDSSVPIVGFGEWHPLNTAARAVLDERPSLPVHALLETYAVLTGFPPPHRAAPEIVDTWLDDRFQELLEAPPVDDQRALVHQLVSVRRMGGAVYDALVGMTARRAGAMLVTADRRAMRIYDAVGVDVKLLE